MNTWTEGKHCWETALGNRSSGSTTNIPAVTENSLSAGYDHVNRRLYVSGLCQKLKSKWTNNPNSSESLGWYNQGDMYIFSPRCESAEVFLWALVLVVCWLLALITKQKLWVCLDIWVFLFGWWYNWNSEDLSLYLALSGVLKIITFLPQCS